MAQIQPWFRSLYIVIFLLLSFTADALPRNRTPKGAAKIGGVGKGAATGVATGAAVGAVAATGKGATAGTTRTSTATDGSTILDKTVVVNGLSLRYKISAPANQFTAASGVTGGAAQGGANGTNGLNILLHGDGGQSFIDFPNQAVQGNLMGVVILAPNANRFWGGGSGLNRVDGVAHAAAVNSLIQNQLPKDVAFDPAKVFFTGVSGGSLLLSGFFIPTFMSVYKTGVLLNCGGLVPQVPVVDGAAMISATTIHFQSTQNELASLQPAIPAAIKAYEALAKGAGLSAQQIGTLQTADNTPVGGHCAFDGKGFVSGIQLMADNFAKVIQPGATGQVTGIGNVLKTVVGNENLSFGTPT